jgi:hypothetical protein
MSGAFLLSMVTARETRHQNRRLSNMRVMLRASAIIGLTALVAAGCNPSSTTSTQIPTGSIAFTTPAGGETFTIGDTVNVVWACDSCADVPVGDYVQVYAYDGVSGYLVDGSGQMTDSLSWVVGSTLQSVSLLPGTYQMVVQDAAGYYQTYSRFFQVVATP